jgi:hypothetical protein
VDGTAAEGNVVCSGGNGRLSGPGRNKHKRSMGASVAGNSVGRCDDRYAGPKRYCNQRALAKAANEFSPKACW